jgi:hypothetical protein
MRDTPNKGRKEAGMKQDITIGQMPTDARPSQLNRRAWGDVAIFLVALILGLLVHMTSPRRVSAHLLT